MQDAYAAYGMEHPDFVLLKEKDRRSICCLLLDGAADDALGALAPMNEFHVYRCGGQTAVLLCLPEEEDFLGRLEEQLARLGLCAGLSGPFALAQSAHGCMRKAQIALETGRRLAPGRALYPMDEFGEAALLLAAKDTLAREGFEAGDYCDAAIDQMRRMDRETGTQYARSLHAYLNHGLDLRRASEALAVHRNTLAYRMRRVQELFGLDLENVNTCFELLFSFWLSEYLPEGQQIDREAPFDAAAAEQALFACVQRRAGLTEAVCAGFAVRLLAVGVSSLADEERTRLLLALRRMAPVQCACAFDDDVIYFALPSDAFEAFERSGRSLWEMKGCRAAATQPFPASRLAKRAALCKMALRASGARYIRTQDIASTLLFMTLERSFSLAPYLCEDVIRVMDEDAVRGSSLSRSLYAYLLYFRDMKHAAANLDMHRNTMEYQLRKIDALVGKPAGEKQRFLMMCTFKMLALPDDHE